MCDKNEMDYDSDESGEVSSLSPSTGLILQLIEDTVVRLHAEGKALKEIKAYLVKALRELDKELEVIGRMRKFANHMTLFQAGLVKPKSENERSDNAKSNCEEKEKQNENGNTDTELEKPPKEEPVASGSGCQRVTRGSLKKKQEIPLAVDIFSFRRE